MDWEKKSLKEYIGQLPHIECTQIYDNLLGKLYLLFQAICKMGTSYYITNLLSGLGTQFKNTISGVINTAVNSKNYFKLSSSNINFTLNNSGSFEYYVVLWLSDDGSNQLDTVNKVYKGSFTFETMNGGTVSATFNS